jgi:outer membrane protein OmpA-like peptidoglycan-associated protein
MFGSVSNCKLQASGRNLQAAGCKFETFGLFLGMRAIFFLALLIASPSLLIAQDEAAAIAFLNTQYDEQAPVLSPDGTLLVFTVDDHPDNFGGVLDHGDIWFSVKTETGWGKPFHGGKLINNGYHNVAAGFSPDGTQLFLMGHYQQNGKPVGSQGISVSIRNGEKWSAPVNIVVPYFKNFSEYYSGFLSADGKVLVYSAVGYETRSPGADDIYFSLKVNGKWTEPKSVGNNINSRGQDVSPSLSSDGKRMYFASNGYKDSVSFDIYYADRLDDSWTRWSRPVNMGPDVNGPGRELFYRVTPTGAIFTTTQSSDQFADLKYMPSKDSVQLPVMINPTEEIKIATSDTIKIDEVVYQKQMADGTTRIWGKVTNAKNNEPIPGAMVIFSATKPSQANASADGNFTITLPGVQEYSVKVEAPGFIGEFERLDLKTQLMKELEMNFRLLPVEVGTTINLKSVLFERSKPILLASSYDELDMVIDFMKQNPKVEILLSGHTDNQGRHDVNMKLSRERVAKVKDYLVSKGISGNRITGKGFGGSKPIADNDADETRALNRRVEFTIVKD